MRIQLKVAEISHVRRQAALDSPENMLCEEGQSSESVTIVSNSSNGPPPESESSDTSLKLG